MSKPESGIVDELTEVVNELFKYRDLYFESNPIERANNKTEDVKTKMNETLLYLDSKECTVKNKALFFMLKGKVLNILPTYNSQAEELLSKSVKLNPKLVEAWNDLGECYWKKKDIDSARNCFIGALQHSYNKVSLRNLSMVLRQFGSSREEKLSMITESVSKAKEAVALDIKDGTSWLILGNAYLSQFFGGTQSDDILQLSMKAYAHAAKDPVAKSNPDLYYNKSMLHLYQSDFNSALLGFQQAFVLDPGWDDPCLKVTMLKSYMASVENIILAKGKTIGKNKMTKLLASLDENCLGAYSGGNYTSPLGKTVQLDHKPISALDTGANANCVVCGRVIGNLSVDPAVPYTFVIMDRDEACIAICLYNVYSGYGVNSGDSVAIPEPYVLNQFSDDNSEVRYRFIRVETPMVLVVNGKKLGIEKQAPTVLKLTTQGE